MAVAWGDKSIIGFRFVKLTGPHILFIFLIRLSDSGDSGVIRGETEGGLTARFVAYSIGLCP
jgi:hypothetical protein